jgi:hypothetical protein
VFKGVAFRELRVGRSLWRLPQSRDPGLQGSTHCGYCGYCVHGSHLLPMDDDLRNAIGPATRCATGIMPVAVSLSLVAHGDTPGHRLSAAPPRPDSWRENGHVLEGIARSTATTAWADSWMKTCAIQPCSGQTGSIPGILTPVTVRSRWAEVRT